MEFEIDNNLAILRLPEGVNIVRIYIGPDGARQRVELVEDGGVIAAKVVAAPGCGSLRKACSKVPELAVTS